jgi:hypothetical protein
MSRPNQKVVVNNTNKSKPLQNQVENNNLNSQNKETTVTVDLDLNKENKISQKVECSGKTPSARFGHTLTMVSSSKIVMFGGAVGDTKNFVFSNETYTLNLSTKLWTKLDSKNKYYLILVNEKSLPCPRAAHAACGMGENQLLMYGGSIGCRFIKLYFFI